MENDTHTCDNSQAEMRCNILRKRTYLEIFLIVTTVTVFVAFLATLGVFVHGKHIGKQFYSSTCLSPGCIRQAARIIRNMDRSIDPCEDFYNFSCGTFLKTPLSITDGVNRALGEEATKYMKRLTKGILDTPIDEGQPEFVKKLKKYYNSCVNVSQDVAEIIEEVLEKTGFKIWPILDDSKDPINSIENILAMVTTCTYWQERPSIIDISRLGNSTAWKLRLEVGYTYLGLNALLNTTEYEYVRKKEKYKYLLSYTMHKLKVPMDAVQTVVEEIVEFETNLGRIEDEYHESSEKNESESTLKEFSSTCTGINWALVVNKIYEYLGGSQDFDEEIIVTFNAKNYFHEVCDLLAETSNRTIYNYLVWTIVINNLRDIHKFYEIYYDNEISWYLLDHIPLERAILCTTICFYYEFQPATSYLIIKHLQPENIMEEAVEYVNGVMKAMEQTFLEEGWFDSVSRDIARERLNNITSLIGYAKESLDIDLLEKYYSQINVTDSYIENKIFIAKWEFRASLLNNTFKLYDHIEMPWPTWTNAFYSPKTQRIALTLGSILPPNLMATVPKYLNYGMLGTSIGHELTHAFGNLEYEYNKTNLCPEETVELFKQRKQCFIDQYSKFRLGSGDVMVDGSLTFDEIVADSGGIILSFKAYKNYVLQNGPEQALPGLEFTNEQLFFIRYAQDECEVNWDEEMMYESNTHLPSRHRIIGSLQNFPLFSEVFNCPLGSFMNPTNKCHMYG